MTAENNICDYCLSNKLILAYEPKTTERNLKVYICEECDLIQSWPRLSGVYKRKVNVTGDAGWGRIRYGKRLNLVNSLKHIEDCIPLDKLNSILDIGANRLYFLKEIGQRYKNLRLYGIENDLITLAEEDLDQDITIFKSKYEDAKIKNQKFDFIHSSHTAEHVVSPKHLFEKTYDWLNEGGYLYLEVPDTKIILDKDIIYEYFIDNHLFHFSEKTLLNYLNLAHFKVLKVVRGFNYLAVIAKKTLEKDYEVINVPDTEPKVGLEEVLNYSENRTKNLENISKASEVINSYIKNQKVVFWGGARIFDVFFRYGNVNWNSSLGLIDKNLVDYVDQVNGVKLSKPELLKEVEVDILVIFSDEYFDEIVKEAKALVKKPLKFLKYNQIGLL